MKMCLNWKVLGALAAVGAGVWLVAPSLLGAALPLLLLAACPLSMLIMMWGMGRMGGMRTSATEDMLGAQDHASREARVAALKAQRDSLAHEINELEARDAARSAELEVARPR